jgi:hypothetical protein
VDFPHVQAVCMSDGLHLILGNVSVLPLDRLEVFKDAVGVVCFRT